MTQFLPIPANAKGLKAGKLQLRATYAFPMYDTNWRDPFTGKRCKVLTVYYFKGERQEHKYPGVIYRALPPPGATPREIAEQLLVLCDLIAIKHNVQYEIINMDHIEKLKGGVK